MSKTNVFIVDSFSPLPFKGNPAAVCLLSDPMTDEHMQHIAAEFNLSETAFLLEEGGEFSLRWFTPVTEVDLCGHATLATAAVLFRQGRSGIIDFRTKSGILKVWQEEDRIIMRFPLWSPQNMPVSPELCNALRVTALSQAVYHGKGDIILLRVADAKMVRHLHPSGLERFSADGIIVTAVSDEPGIDFICRFFAPRIGIPEDPVTGAAHCILAPFWKELLNKQSLVSYQASARGGRVYIKVENNHVLLGGQAAIVVEGTLTV